MKPTNKDWYESFEALSASELEGVDFRIAVTARPSSVAIVAPHGGHIEPHTSEIAAEDFSLYLFEGLRSGRHHRELHVTSDRFAEPRALALVQGAQMVLGVHGRENKDDGETVWVGGLDFASRDRIVAALIGAGFAAVARQPGQTLAGAARNNICNRCKTRKGVQLEIPRTLRDRLSGNAALMATLADAVARAVSVV